MASPSLVEDVVTEEKLVDIWPDYPCLYDVRSPEFKNRDKREKAVAEMAQKLEQTGDWVKMKIRNLRNSYTKLKKAPSSGSARKSAGKRATWLLDKLQFLAPHVATRNSISNIDIPLPSTNSSEISITSTEDDILDLSEVECPIQLQDTPEPSEASTSSVITNKTKTRGLSLKRQHGEDKLIQCLTQSITSKLNKKTEGNKQNPNTAFASYVSSQLSELDAKTRAVAQHKINDILFQAQMGNLIENHPRQLLPHQYMNYRYETRPWNVQSTSQPMGLPQGYQHQNNDWATTRSHHADGMAPPRMDLTSLNQADVSQESSLTTL